jgi:hypothetical protein
MGCLRYVESVGNAKELERWDALLSKLEPGLRKHMIVLSSGIDERSNATCGMFVLLHTPFRYERLRMPDGLRTPENDEAAPSSQPNEKQEQSEKPFDPRWQSAARGRQSDQSEGGRNPAR